MNQPIYDQFLTHTSLADSLHKAVFVKLASLINTLNSIKFISVEYAMPGNTEKTSIVFSEVAEVPVFVADFLVNAFKHTYTVPEQLEGIIKLEVDGNIYSVICENSKFRIPQAISFLENSNLIDFIFDYNRHQLITNILIDAISSSTHSLPKVFEDLFLGSAVLSVGVVTLPCWSIFGITGVSILVFFEAFFLYAGFTI